MHLKSAIVCLLLGFALAGCATKNTVCVENQTDSHLSYFKVQFLEQGWSNAWSETPPGETRCYETNNPASGYIEATAEQSNRQTLAHFTAPSQDQPLIFRVIRDPQGHLIVESDSAEATWDDRFDLASDTP